MIKNKTAPHRVGPPAAERHCVIYGVESWSGVLEWSHGVESWSEFWSGMKSDMELLLPFSDRICF